MIDVSDRAHRHRLDAFGITADDMQLLQENAAFVCQSLPGLLEQLHDAFTPWLEIRQALRHPAVHGPRLVQWGRVICGDFGEGFSPPPRHWPRACIAMVHPLTR